MTDEYAPRYSPPPAGSLALIAKRPRKKELPDNE